MSMPISFRKSMVGKAKKTIEISKNEQRC